MELVGELASHMLHSVIKKKKNPNPKPNKRVQSSMIKTLNKGSIKRTFLDIIKTICDKSTANILSYEKLKAFPQRSRPRQGYALSPVLFSMVLELLAITAR